MSGFNNEAASLEGTASERVPHVVTLFCAGVTNRGRQLHDNGSYRTNIKRSNGSSHVEKGARDRAPTIAPV